MNNIKTKKYILCIETTSNICGVAIVFDNKTIYENNLDKGLNHSITLFDNINNALKLSNLNMKDIDVIKVSNGPGSFTGLRIGIAAALGLSKPYNTKIEYVDTLDSLAHNILTNYVDYNIIHHTVGANNIHPTVGANFRSPYINNNFILSMIDARVNRVYISLYNGTTFEKLSKDSIVTIDELCLNLNKHFLNKKIYFALVGNGAINYKNILQNNLIVNYKIYDKVSNLSASALAFTNGVISEVPFTNYLLASKAEREKFNK